MASSNAITNIENPAPYRQAMAPSYGVATYVADDTDNHDFRFRTGGKSGLLITINNPSDQAVTIDTYGAPTLAADIGDANVKQIGSQLSVAATANGEVLVGKSYPFILVRATSASSGDATTVQIYLHAHPGITGVIIYGPNGEELVTSTGMQVQGSAAHDAPNTGNPLKIGGRFQSGTADTVDDDDVADILVDDKGRIFTAPAAQTTADGFAAVTPVLASNGTAYPLATAGYALAPDGNHDQIRALGDTAGAGLGVVAAAPWTPGASDVKSLIKTTVSNSTTRVTAITPSSGKKVRIVSVEVTNASSTVTTFGVYFGTGATYVADATKGICEPRLDVTDAPQGYRAWPDGGGPIGAADEVVSLVTGADISASGRLTIQYREE